VHLYPFYYQLRAGVEARTTRNINPATLGFALLYAVSALVYSCRLKAKIQTFADLLHVFIFSFCTVKK